MKLIDNIVKDMIEEHEGGEKFFDNLDKEVQSPPIVEALISKIPSDQFLDYIIVSGKFGRFFSSYYSSIGRIVKYKVICVRGGLRSGNLVDDISYLPLEGKRVVFLDDSYYLGRTRNVIKEELERNGAKLLKTIVAYDGSKVKDKDVVSLFRYYDNYKEEVKDEIR